MIVYDVKSQRRNEEGTSRLGYGHQTFGHLHAAGAVRGFLNTEV